jgi:tetratricopeptide (TPR) repeat protein
MRRAVRGIGWIAVTAAVLLAAPARADASGAWDDCRGNDFKLAVQACTATLRDGALSGADLAMAYGDRGFAYERLDQLDKAIADFDAAIRLKPDYALAFGGRGLAYDNKGDTDRAIADYSQALRLKPDLTEALNNRAKVYFDRGDLTKAMADFSQAIRLRPDFFIAFDGRANVYAKRDEPLKAIVDYTEALRLRPDYANALNGRGAAYSDMGDYGRAIADYIRAVGLQPDFADGFNNLANAYDRLGDYDRAIVNYDRAIAIEPNNANAFNGRGNAYQDKGDYAHAIADYGRAISLDPRAAVSLNNRGSAFSSLGDYTRAVADFDQVLRLNPKFATAYANRGVAEWDLRKNDKAAVTDLGKALALDSHLDYAKKKLKEILAAQSAVALRQATASTPGRKSALVIGNSVYDTLPRLPNAAADARAVAKSLTAMGYDVTTVYDKSAAEIKAALDTFARTVAPAADTALIWYSGHGQSFSADGGDPSARAALQSDNYVLPVDFRPGDDVLSKAVSLGDLMNATLSAGKLHIVVVDACRPNQMKGARPGFTAGAQPTAPAPGIQPLIENLMVVYSTSPGQTAADGAQGQHSPFVQAFLDLAAKGKAKNDISAFFLGVKSQTEDNSETLGSHQSPDIIAMRFSGDSFSLARAPAPQRLAALR